MEPAVITGPSLALAAARRLLFVPPPHGFASISTRSSIGGGGGGNGGFFGGSGGGGGDSDAGAAAAAAAAAALGETGTAEDDVILLHVGGMSCGGCASKVKRILESQPEVASATVDFDKATAAVWTTPEAKQTEDWQKQLGEKLALHLSNCGFQAHLHGEAGDE
ncbi:uncharacterized protein [Lolium perenne]|uniref:uncharacterized protein n=1 Tax=Lolium perenne TaxID=4522 RepID=UPI0021EA2099|nr:copper-transporting ATPase PAA1, chloroplastic-like [Lolium perenne]